MAGTKFKPGDKIRHKRGYTYNGKEVATVVAQPEYIAAESNPEAYANAVWADWWPGSPSWSNETDYELVEAAPVADVPAVKWRTVTKKQKRILKGLFNNSVEFRIQVRVKGD